MGLMETINYYYYDLSDPRMRDWFLMNSIWYPIIVTLIYIAAVFKLAPAFMKNRPAYKLNTYIKCYNIFQIVANAIVVKQFVPCYPFLRSFECRPITYSTDVCSMTIVKYGYFVIWLKLIDLSETVVFILRKKNNQVSFLHVYHHITTFDFGMILARYLSSEVSLLFPLVNCSVHVIMYSYYLLSNFEGPIKKMIAPYKHYVTLIQMAQFVIVSVQYAAAFLKNCDVPQGLLFFVLLNMIINFCLFYRFYKKTYIDSKRKGA